MNDVIAFICALNLLSIVFIDFTYIYVDSQKYWFTDDTKMYQCYSLLRL